MEVQLYAFKQSKFVLFFLKVLTSVKAMPAPKQGKNWNVKHMALLHTKSVKRDKVDKAGSSKVHGM